MEDKQNHLPSKDDQYSLFDLPRLDNKVKATPTTPLNKPKPVMGKSVRFMDYDLTKQNCSDEVWQLLGGDLPPISDKDLPF